MTGGRDVCDPKQREGEGNPPMHRDRNTEDRLLRRRRCRSWPRHSRSGQPSLRIDMILLVKAENIRESDIPDVRTL